MYETPERKTASRQSPLPSHLQAGLETIGKRSLNDVRVNYDSSLPESVGAVAVTQGKNIHLGPGQERHLAHEGWHVVQQMADRVKGTTTVGGVSVNDDPHLEREADVMGAEALRVGGTPHALQRMTDEDEHRDTAQLKAPDDEEDLKKLAGS